MRNIMAKKYTKLGLTFIALGVIIAIASTSLAYLKKEIEPGKKVELIAGTLNYTINIEDLNNNNVIIPANSTKRITINATSDNEIDSKYELYYNVITKLVDNELYDIKVAYFEDNIDGVSGNISKDGSITLDIQIKNNLDKDIEIQFGVQGGLPNADFVLTDGIRIVDKVVEENALAMLKTGEEVNIIFKQLAGNNNTVYFYNDKNIRAIRMADSVPNGVTTQVISIDDSKEQALAWYSSETIYIYSPSGIMMNPDSSYMFAYMNSLVNISALTNWNTSNVTNMIGLFQFCGNLVDISPLANWNTSNATNMFDMFQYCKSLATLNVLENWDTSKVTNMGYMFEKCYITDLTPLANWDVSSVNNMNRMFRDCKNLIDIRALTNWNISNVTDMSGLFQFCDNLVDISPLTNWNTSKVTDMNAMFDSCYRLLDIGPLANWDTSKVTDMSVMFSDCRISTISPLSNWNVSNVTNMRRLFEGCYINDLTPLANWDVSKVTDMYSMFNNCTSLTNLNGLEKWDVSNVSIFGVTYYSSNQYFGMFTGCSKLIDISALSNWNTSNVTNMGSMFMNCTSLTNLTPIENWNTSKVTDMSNIFYNIPSSVARPSWYK